MKQSQRGPQKLLRAEGEAISKGIHRGEVGESPGPGAKKRETRSRATNVERSGRQAPAVRMWNVAGDKIPRYGDTNKRSAKVCPRQKRGSL